MKTDPRLASLLRMSEQIELISLLTLFCSLSDLTGRGYYSVGEQSN